VTAGIGGQGPKLSRQYLYVRSRQLEGTFPGTRETGTWVITTARVHKGWGAPPEESWPYDDTVWPPAEPPGIDSVAKRDRLFLYGRVRGLDECRAMLATGNPVTAAFDIDDSWRSCVGGRVGPPSQHAPTGMHTIYFVGYRDEDQMLKFANSWGSSWGDNGFGYLPFAYMSTRLREAWYFDIDRPKPTQPSTLSGVVLRASAVQDPLGRVVHIIELVDRDHDEILGWAFMLQTEDVLELDELFVVPHHRGKGHGRDIANEVVTRARAVDLPLRAWVPHSDWKGPDPARDATLRRLHLTPTVSDQRWAAAVAIPA
jgi:GNAT superfamily N-acetyltransferase